MIPAKWKKLPLDHVAHIQTGLAKGKKDIKNPLVVPYLRVANVQDGYLDLSLIKSIEVEESNIDRYLLKPGDVLLTEGGDFDKLGRGAIWQGEINPCLHQNHIFVVRPKDKSLMPQFLSFLTGSAYGKAYFLKCSKQSTNLASINSTQLKEFPVLLPPLTEQEKIVEAVNAWDSAIEKTGQLIKSKEKIFYWLRNELINQKNEKLGWRKVKLREVVSIPRKEKLISVNGETLLTVRLHCRGIEKNSRIMPKLSEKGRPYYKRFAGEIMIGRQNFHNGGFAVVPKEHDGLIASNAITSLDIEKSKMEAEFLFYFFSRPNFYKRLGHVMDGTGQKELTEKQILDLKIQIPSIEQQKHISAMLNTARQEIDLLKKQLDAYKKQKRGLMQKLLTGQWRVKINSRKIGGHGE